MATKERKVELCAAYWTEKHCKLEDKCPKLHLCRYFLKTNCMNKKDCIFSHDIHDDHNSRIMEKAGLEEMDFRYLKFAYKTTQAAPKRLPDACKFYNGMKNGCKHNDSEYSECPCLHICRYFILDECKYNGRCKSSHRLKDPQPAMILKHYNIDIFNSDEEGIKAELRNFFLVQQEHSFIIDFDHPALGNNNHVPLHGQIEDGEIVENRGGNIHINPEKLQVPPPVFIVPFPAGVPPDSGCEDGFQSDVRVDRGLLPLPHSHPIGYGMPPPDMVTGPPLMSNFPQEPEVREMDGPSIIEDRNIININIEEVVQTKLSKERSLSENHGNLHGKPGENDMSRDAVSSDMDYRNRYESKSVTRMTWKKHRSITDGSAGYEQPDTRNDPSHRGRDRSMHRYESERPGDFDRRGDEKPGDFDRRGEKSYRSPYDSDYRAISAKRANSPFHEMSNFRRSPPFQERRQRSPYFQEQLNRDNYYDHNRSERPVERKSHSHRPRRSPDNDKRGRRRADEPWHHHQDHPETEKSGKDGEWHRYTGNGRGSESLDEEKHFENGRRELWSDDHHFEKGIEFSYDDRQHQQEFERDYAARREDHRRVVQRSSERERGRHDKRYDERTERRPRSYRRRSNERDSNYNIEHNKRYSPELDFTQRHRAGDRRSPPHLPDVGLDADVLGFDFDQTMELARRRIRMRRDDSEERGSYSDRGNLEY